ncbi:MAG: hypothetical protein R3245_07615, partial [Kiloniellales bacterium]|nr:hypothetical protein [Kiloniellales bacterium]
AMFTQDQDLRRKALREAEVLLNQGATGHNYLWFYRDAMEVALREKNWDGVEQYATALETYTRDEPLPWSSFFTSRGRVLSAIGRGNLEDRVRSELHRLRDEAMESGLKAALPALQKANASW